MEKGDVVVDHSLFPDSPSSMRVPLQRSQRIDHSQQLYIFPSKQALSNLEAGRGSSEHVGPMPWYFSLLPFHPYYQTRKCDRVSCICLGKTNECHPLFHATAFQEKERLCFTQQPRRIGPDAGRALLAAVHPTENGGHHRVVEGSEQ
jgi:hypothetical protein